MRKVKWTGHMGEDHTGHLIKIMALGFVDGVTDAIAVVETPNGDIEKVVANRCQFVVPYRSEAQSVDGPFPSWQHAQADVVMHIPPAVGAGPGASPTPAEPCTLGGISSHNCTKTPRSDSYEVCCNCVDLPMCVDRMPY